MGGGDKKSVGWGLELIRELQLTNFILYYLNKICGFDNTIWFMIRNNKMCIPLRGCLVGSTRIMLIWSISNDCISYAEINVVFGLLY